MSTDNIKNLTKELRLGGIKNTIDDFFVGANCQQLQPARID